MKTADFALAGSGGIILIGDAGDHAANRFIRFFTAIIWNGITYLAYGRVVAEFLIWCEQHRLTVRGVDPVHVAVYVVR